MPEVCANTWEMYGREGTIQYLWHWMSWPGRLDVFILAIMLVQVVVVRMRISYRCYLALRAEAIDKWSPEFCRARKKLVADLNLKVNSLKSIASTAPFLGLAGTCVGILGSFHGVGMEKHAAMAMLVSEISAALMTTAVGLVVAVPATWVFNYLQRRIELLGTGIADRPLLHRYPLTKRFSKLSFAVLSAPVLAILVAVFTIFSSPYTPVGFSVRLLRIGALDTIHSVEPIYFEMRGNGPNPAVVYVNSRKARRDELESKLRNELRVNPKAVAYIHAENTVSWGDLMDVIDRVQKLDVNVVLITARSSQPHPQSLRPAKHRG